MEEKKPTSPLQADFLDVRHALRTVANSRGMLLVACVFTAFLLALGAAAWYKQAAMATRLWLLPDALLLLCAALSAVGVWGLYFRRKSLGKGAFVLARFFPYCCALLAGLSVLILLGVGIAAIFSPNAAAAGLGQLAAKLQPTYYKTAAGLLQLLQRAGSWALAAAAICALLLMLLYALRCLLLGLTLKRLGDIQASGLPERARAGFVCVSSWGLGALVFCLGAFVLFTNPTAGVCLLLYGVAMFLAGLPLHEADMETRFLHTYYDKFNKSLKKQIDALRAAAAVPSPLALPTPAEEDAESAPPSEPGTPGDPSGEAPSAPSGEDEEPASPPPVIHLPDAPSGEAPSGEDEAKSSQSKLDDFAPSDASGEDVSGEAPSGEDDAKSSRSQLDDFAPSDASSVEV